MDNVDYELINIDTRSWKPEDLNFWINPEDKTYNACIIFNNKRTRVRASLLIIKGDSVLLCKEPGHNDIFALPGGGLEPGETVVEAAVREAQEEVKISADEVYDTGLDYCECHETVMPWVEEHVPKNKWWYNYYTCLCIGKYDEKYTGKIAKADQDPRMANTAKFYKIADVIDDQSFKPQWQKALMQAGVISVDTLLETAKITSKKLAINEDTRTQQIASSRNTGHYKDQSHGKNRFERKRLSKVANAVKQFNKINMNELFKHDTLIVEIPVTGETNSYMVTIKMNGVITEIAKNIKNNKNIFEYKTIIQALTKLFNTTDVYVNCTCDDYKYRFAHWNIVHNTSSEDSSHDPGPGKGIANPHDDKGRGCKHVLLVLANGDWMMKVASVINNYVHYTETHMEKAFKQLIFPKLYGCTVEDAVDTGILPEETDLKSDKELIELANDYGRNRGKYLKGSNKNPITGTGGKAKQTTTEPAE